VISETASVMVAIRRGGQLSATTYAIDDRVFLEVRDAGNGISRIWTSIAIFKTTKLNGTGLGLPFVRQIISAHQEFIDYMSEPGTGTTFKISLPIHRRLASCDRQRWFAKSSHVRLGCAVNTQHHFWQGFQSPLLYRLATASTPSICALFYPVQRGLNSQNAFFAAALHLQS
jgi:hypothetical protein